MPMPQRNSRRVVQLLSNNSLLSGSGASGISSGLVSNCLHGTGSTNNTITSGGIIPPNTSTAAPNGRLYGNPVAAAAAAAAAASVSASALNTISASASAAHHHQPPLITDTLTACLDVNGTYICTSYSPRCYIIQKVTPNTVTVTPHGIGGEAPSPNPGIVTGNNPPQAQPVPGPSFHHPAIPPPPHSSSSIAPLPVPRKLIKPGVHGVISSSVSSPPQRLQTSHQNSFPPPAYPHRQFHQHQQHPPPVPHSHSHPHTHNPTPPGNQQNVHQHQHHHSYQNRHPPIHSYSKPIAKHTGGASNERIAAPYVPFPRPGPTNQSGRAYMNGEVGSATTVFPGEDSTPAMVLQSSASASAGPQISENRTFNGLKDGTGMSRDQMKSVESIEIDSADISRRHDPGSGAIAVSSDIPKEELKRLLLQQLEYYFSPENLANDKFLVSQMDSDHYVSISTLANFNMVKKLTGDIDLVTEVLRDSKNVQVHSDGKRVRPVSHRTVVILRGIPEITPVDEIKALFNSENCPKCNSCEFAFNDSWYVSFESDEDAQRAHRYLREDVKEFKGQPIMARIKSRPTTLLAQGAGVHLKNGFHQPPQVMGPYMPPAYVPGSQTGPTSAVAPSPMFAHSQVQSVFPLPPNYSYTAAAWQGYFGLGPDQISQMYPMNGLPPQHQSSSTYPKTLPMNPRPRNPNNQVRPRRHPPSSTDNQGINGVVGAGANSSAVGSHQSYGNPPRKTNAPPPLLNIVPNTSALPLVNPTSHNHSQIHMPHTSVQVSGNAISQNGSRHYANSLPSSHSMDSYHPSGSTRPFRSSAGDSRPRSSLSNNRKGPPRREEETSYDGPSASPSSSAKVPSTRGVAPVPVSAPVPPPPTESVNPHQPQGKMNFDLEGSAFPPLPGSGLSIGKNGDAVFEGRLSDVVKGVKNMKVAGSSDKEDSKSSIVNVSTEIIVSVEENQTSGDVREVSAASPVAEIDIEKNPEHSSSHVAHSGKKEFREIGVGSADDTHDIRSSQYKSSVVSTGRNKETADKSTRTDEALLNGDQISHQGMKHGSSSSCTSYSQTSSLSQNGGRKSTMSQSITVTNKSPIPGKRAVPALQVQNVSSSGPEVPYSSSRTVTSPVATAPAKASTSQAAGLGSGHNPGFNTANSTLGRGANVYVAKASMDNNNTRANGLVSNNTGHNVNAVDKDAFPSPDNGKSVPTCKPFPVSTDQVTRTESEKKESGQGEAKKGDDCSNEERDGPVRLSYAQVAQTRKEGGGGVGVPNATATQSSTAAATNCIVSSNNTNSALAAHTSSSSVDEKRKPNPKDIKDARNLPKGQRSGGGGDRDTRFRNRGVGRNRMMSDHSDGGSGTSGESTRRLPKPSRESK